jgi:hypothetical protein
MMSDPTAQDFDQARGLLNQLLKEVSEQESTLAGGTKLGPGGKAIRGVLDTEVSFGFPDDKLTRLDGAMFAKLNIPLSPIQQQQLDSSGYNFYYMTLNTSIVPKQDAAFNQVECKLDFNPKGTDKPIIQTYFPVREWKEILRMGASLKLALSGNLEWQAEVSGLSPTQLEKLPLHLQARITNVDEINAFVVIPNYVYSLGKSEITATGEGNFFCYWRIEKVNLQKTQNLTFVVVFKVPGGTETLDLIGWIRFNPSIAWLTNKIRPVFSFLGKALQALFLIENKERKDELFIGAYEKWTLDLRNCTVTKSR